MKKLLSIMMLLSGVVLADPPTSKVLDFATATPAPTLELYRGDSKTVNISLLNGNVAITTNGYTPICYFYGFSTVNVACVWISSNAMQVSFSTNNLATAGTYYYCAGVSNLNGVTVAQRGTLKITSH